MPTGWPTWRWTRRREWSRFSVTPDMSDRKYRQRGYQDDDRPRGPRPESGQRKPPEPRDPRLPRDPRVPNMPGFRQVFKCARCGAVESPEVGSASKCGKCGAENKVKAPKGTTRVKFACKECGHTQVAL